MPWHALQSFLTYPVQVCILFTIKMDSCLYVWAQWEPLNGDGSTQCRQSTGFEWLWDESAVTKCYSPALVRWEQCSRCAGGRDGYEALVFGNEPDELEVGLVKRETKLNALVDLRLRIRDKFCDSSFLLCRRGRDFCTNRPNCTRQKIVMIWGECKCRGQHCFSICPWQAACRSCGK